MKTIVSFGLGLIAGAACFYLVFGQSDTATYAATEEISLRFETTNLGVLPKGQPVVALGSSSFEPDIGWFGCIPVNFGTGFEARKLLEPSAESPTANVRLFASHSD
jgi:hypothetical protein